MKTVRDLSVTSAVFAAGQATAPWYSSWLSPSSGTAPTMVLDFAANVYGMGANSETLDNLVSLSRASDGSFVNSGGFLQIAGPNQFRLTHDPVSLGRLGLLIEKGTQNFVGGSDMPTGQTVSLAAGTYALSFFGTGQVGMTGIHVETIQGAGTYPTRTTTVFSIGAGDLILNISGDVTAAQLEVGNEASSYASTVSGSGLRDNDLATLSTGTWFSGSAGSIVFSGHLDGAANNDRIIEIDSGAASSRISLLWNSGLAKPQMQAWNSGSLQAAIAPPGAAVQFGSPFRVAIAFAQNDFAISLNGGSLASDALGTLPAGLTTLRLGRSSGGAQGLMNIESLTYYPTRLSDAELQLMSA